MLVHYYYSNIEGMSGCVNSMSFICEQFLIFKLKAVKLKLKQELVLDKERRHSERYKI